jgi:hypothetical protein
MKSIRTVGFFRLGQVLIRNRRFRSAILPVIVGLAMLAACRFAIAQHPMVRRTVVTPTELPDAVLHNPDMGWVLYENYAVDQDPKGSSTLLTLPDERFAGVDAVALMFSWQDIEKSPDVYDFSKVDFAYDYWHHRGKAIQLRLSSESLLWWANRTLPAGKGVPDYVLAHLSLAEKQTRELDGTSYVVVDSRNLYYRERLAKCLRAVESHFSSKRPITLIDLRGFGAWGEWHSGFKYPTLDARHDALKGIIDLWSDALPTHRLALSYSYDPDGPKAFYAGTTSKYDERVTGDYEKYLHYSAFDYALTKRNIAFRRDGCGGAVHSNERKLNDEAFRLGRGPMFSEFIDGYQQSKAGDANWIKWKIDDALSLHPNYMSLLGWQGTDALAFLKERPELIKSALMRMGYRLVPTQIAYPMVVRVGKLFDIEMRWVNRGVGRALRDYEVRYSLHDRNECVVATSASQQIRTSKWVSGEEYVVHVQSRFERAPAGDYLLAITLRDNESGAEIEMPIGRHGTHGYRIGRVRLMADKECHRTVQCCDDQRLAN